MKRESRKADFQPISKAPVDGEQQLFSTAWIDNPDPGEVSFQIAYVARKGTLSPKGLDSGPVVGA